MPLLQKTGELYPHLVLKAPGGVSVPPVRRHLQYLPLAAGVCVRLAGGVFRGAVYFFHKFILDDVDLTTVFQVILPFAVFFLLSLFLSTWQSR